MSGSGTGWYYSTTSVSAWTTGSVTFLMEWGGSAGEATTTFSSAASTTFTNVRFDKTAPSAFTTGAASSTGGTLTSGYWNGTNTGVQAVVATEIDSTAVGGTQQLQANVGGVAFASIGTPRTILTADSGNNVYLTANAAAISGLTGYIEGGTIYFRVVTTDAAGNATNGATSSSSLVIDTSAGNPTADPEAGNYTGEKFIELAATGADSIRYTTDGTTPTCSSGTVYSTAVDVSSSLTINAIGCDTAGNASDVSTFAYTIKQPNSAGGGGGGGGGGSSTHTLPAQAATPAQVNSPNSALTTEQKIELVNKLKAQLQVLLTKLLAMLQAQLAAMPH